jgi:hypothetical protein
VGHQAKGFEAVETISTPAAYDQATPNTPWFAGTLKSMAALYTTHTIFGGVQTELTDLTPPQDCAKTKDEAYLKSRAFLRDMLVNNDDGYGDPLGHEDRLTISREMERVRRDFDRIFV